MRDPIGVSEIMGSRWSMNTHTWSESRVSSSIPVEGSPCHDLLTFSEDSLPTATREAGGEARLVRGLVVAEANLKGRNVGMTGILDM